MSTQGAFRCAWRNRYSTRVYLSAAKTRVAYNQHCAWTHRVQTPLLTFCSAYSSRADGVIQCERGSCCRICQLLSPHCRSDGPPIARKDLGGGSLTSPRSHVSVFFSFFFWHSHVPRGEVSLSLVLMGQVWKMLFSQEPRKQNEAAVINVTPHQCVQHQGRTCRARPYGRLTGLSFVCG